MIKPRVSKAEWENYIRPALAAKGVEQRERERLFGYLFTSFDQDRGNDVAGIEADEITEIISYLRAHPNEHHIAASKIDILEALLKKYL